MVKDDFRHRLALADVDVRAPAKSFVPETFRLDANGLLAEEVSMNVFVTGGAGYIGSVCVEELLNAGHDVTVYDNLTEGHRAAVDNRAVFILSRLSESATLHETLKDAKTEVIVHFAASAQVSESMRDPGKYFRNNVSNGQRLLEAAVQAGVRKFVFSSSCAVYGLPAKVPISEEFPLQPVSPYGESKLMFERMLKWYQQIHGLEFMAFRYFNAAGASEQFGEHHHHESHLIPNLLRVALGLAPRCEIYGTDYPTPDGTCIRDYIHVRDLAQAHILAMEPGRRGIYNLGTGRGYSVREVLNTCEKVSGQEIAVVEKPRRAGDPPALVAAADKVRSELGWEPRQPALEDIVRSAWLWHKNHPRGYGD